MPTTVYDVKFGNYRTQLKIIYFNLDSNSLFCNELLGIGGFGQVISFRTITGEFALKNIKSKKSKVRSIDEALQQIFMAKVLSALQVGPKFIELFSYDAIAFNNCVQFAMEVCRTKFKKSEIEDQIKSKSLLKLLKTLHTLNICHMDIKTDNIAWSPSLNRFVFLDFTFTKFIKELIGCKTLTGFEGTFHYASPQMKKRCILQGKSFVDLYYNDLHCLEGTWKQMEASLNQSDRMFEFFEAFKKDKQTERLTYNSAIVRYFKLKMSFFMKNVSQVITLAQKQKCLAQTFRKIFMRYQEKNGISKGVCAYPTQKENPSLQKAAQIDNILLRYEVEMEQNPLLVSLLEIVEDGSQPLFEQAWQEDSYRQKMFFFIDVYSNPDLQNQNLRKNLIDKIYCQIEDAKSEASYTMRFKKVIEFYGSYFCKKKNIEVVEKIMSYFVLMHDRQTKEKLGDMMLSNLLQEEKYLEYNERNFKYFLAEIATMNSISAWHFQRYIQNSRNFIQQISKKAQPTDSLVVEISETHRLMKMIKNYRIGNTFNKMDLTQYFELIISRLNKKRQEIREIAYQILGFSRNQQLSAINAKKKYVLKDHFLQKCALQMFIINFIIREQVYSLRMLIESDDFLSKFLTLSHLMILNLHNKPQKQKSVEICESYLKIEQDSSWGLQTQQLWVLSQFHDNAQIANYKLDWLINVKLSDISSLEKLQNLKAALQEIIFYFVHRKYYGKDYKMLLENEIKLGEVALSLLEYSTDIIRIMKQEAVKNNSPELNQYIYFKQAVIKQIRLKDLYQKGLALLLLDRLEQAMVVALEIIDDAIEFQYHSTFFGFVTYIWDSRSEHCMEQANKLRLKLIPHLMKLDFRENLLQSYTCLKSVMKALKNNEMFSEAFSCLHELCRYVESNSINVTNTNLFLEIKELLQIWWFSQLKQFVQTRIKWRLSEFISCPAMAYILHKASQLFPQAPLDQSQRQRLVTVLVTFVRNLSYGSFSDYRRALYSESFQLKKRKFRTLTELRRLALQKTLAVFTDTFTSCRKGRHKSLFSREAMEQMVQSTSRKAQSYYTNCKGKTKAAD